MRPEEARVLTERNIMPARGPKFFRDDDDGAVQFQFVIDSTNIVGPRAAGSKDEAEHPEAWGRFLEADGGLVAEHVATLRAVGDAAFVVTADGSEHETLLAASDHAASQRKQVQGQPKAKKPLRRKARVAKAK